MFGLAVIKTADLLHFLRKEYIPESNLYLIKIHQAKRGCCVKAMTPFLFRLMPFA